MKNYFWENILNWYYDNKREFPWRKTDNPFYILIAEILLQQTNVRKVEPVYNEIINSYKVPSELRNADLNDLKRTIKPLGLLYRAERLINISEIITNEYNGEIPSYKSALKSLPGIGDYIADAVLCYGFRKNTIPIDTNVIRLFSRFFGLKSSYSRLRNDKELLNQIRNLYDFKDFREPNFAVLDFAAEVCSAKKPKCSECIVKNKCNFYTSEDDNIGKKNR
jgi:A/G-specific adenine glycosylase